LFLYRLFELFSGVVHGQEIHWMHLIFRSSRQFAKLAQALKPALFPVLFALALVASTPLRMAFAQSSTTGAIGGVVSDSNGALLPGSTVTVKSVDNGTARTVKTNGSGEYRVSELEPGVYTAAFASDGFKSYEETSITVTVGSISNVSPKLQIGSVTDKVEVTDQTAIMHADDNAISTTIDSTQIENLPINGRRWSDFARLTPGVVSNGDGFGLLSFRGISFLLNNNTIDGADDNQAYYSEARGRTRTAFSVPPSAIQEFQVNTSNYSAQYGRAAGGVINTVTRSGTNQFHGEAFFFDRDNDLGGATNPYTLLSVPNGNGGYNSVPTKPTDWRKNWGFTLGGPLLRDKLYFIYTYDQERRNFPAIARPTDPNNFFAPSNAILPGGETCSTTAFTTKTISYSAEGDYNSCLIAALYGVSFQAGSAYYQQGLGILQSFIGPVSRRQDQVINLPKIDYQINERNRLSLLYNRMRYSSPHGLYSQATNNRSASGFGNDNVKEDFGIARLTSVLSNSIINEALVQYGRDFEFDYQAPNLPNEAPLANNQFGHAAGSQIGFFFNSGVNVGSNEDLPRIADPDERRLQLLDGLTWSHGKHVSKFGLEYNKVSDYDNNLFNGNGSYSYDWTYNFIADYLNATTGVGGTPYTYTAANPTCPGGAGGYCQTYFSFSQGFGSSSINIATREYAGYATDDWRILPNLTLTLGVRYEYEYIPPSPTPNPDLNGQNPLFASSFFKPNTYNRPDDRNNIGPRAGFTWNVFSDSKTILRGGYGIYYGRIINSNIAQTYLEPGSTSGQENVSSLYPGHGGPSFPNIYSSFAALQAQAAQQGIASFAPSAAFFSKHMQNPQVHEADLAIEQNMGHNTTFGVTYMMSLGRELPTGFDTNLNQGAVGSYTPVIASATTSATLFTYPVSTNSEAPTSLANYPQPPSTDGYTVFPHGGAKQPILPANYQQKVYYNSAAALARIDPSYFQILQIQSSVNSSYNALAFQVDHRYEHGLSLLTNFTWSHSLDENPYESTVVPSFTLNDPANPRSDYGNGATDVRLRYVGAVVYEPQTHFHGIENQLLGGWRIAPLVQIQTGLPYSPTISSTLKEVAGNNGIGNVFLATTTGSNPNGSGSSSTRVPWIARNSFNDPKTAVFDLRLGKNFYFNFVPHMDRMRLEVFAEIFNVMNHQNITGVTTEAYTLSSASPSFTPQLTPYANFGTYTSSNSNYTYSPRQVQITARLHF
jgi:Carboxypeptidase regulatory-like domain/TonB-dependent Receptor Plug Domain/TonB dependent receptor